MKVIIAGSRTITAYSLVESAVARWKNYGLTIEEIVCGEAKGIDLLGRHYGEQNGIPIKSFPADWDKHGKKAGYLRNSQMVEYADGLIAITTGSPGTQHTIELAKEKGIPLLYKRVYDWKLVDKGPPIVYKFYALPAEMYNYDKDKQNRVDSSSLPVWLFPDTKN